jgi:hypothetical protein
VYLFLQADRSRHIKEIMKQQEIFDKFKTLDNSGRWSFCGEIAKVYKDYKTAIEYIERDKQQKETKKGLDFAPDLLDDKDALRTHVLQHLYQESSKGNAQASDKLAKIAGLSESSQDITIEIISFKDLSRERPGQINNKQIKTDETTKGGSKKSDIGK